MLFFLTTIIAVLMAAAQLSIAPKLAIFSVPPNFILALILAGAISPLSVGRPWVFYVFVLFFDLVAGQPFGLLSLAFWLTFFFVQLLGGRVFKQNNFLAVLFLVFIGSLLFESLKLILGRAFVAVGWPAIVPSISPGAWLRDLLIGFLFLSLLAPLFIFCLKQLRRLKGYELFLGTK